MVKRNRRQPAIDTDRASENLSKFSFPSKTSRTLSSRKTETSLPDELITSLAEAYENKRARQVNEWERRQGAGSFA